MATVTKPIALDETLQDTNTAIGGITTALGTEAGKLDDIKTAINGIALASVGNLSSLATTDKTSLVGAVNELAGDIDDLDTDKANKVSSATAGNLAGLDSNGDLTDANWSADKTTQSATGNPISISGLKSNQLAINPIITFEPIQAGSGTSSPSNIRAISGYDKVEVESCGKNIIQGMITGYNISSVGVISVDTGYSICYARVKANQKYTISDGASQSVYAFYFEKPKANATSYNDSRSVTTDHTFTAPINGYVAFRITSSYTTPQLEEGNQATTYIEPVKTTSISESLGQTVYWGRYLPRTGEFEVLGVGVDMGDLTWTFRGTNTPFYSTALSNYYWNDSTQAPPLICSCYETVDQGHRRNYTIAGYNMATNTIMVNDNGYNGDASAFTTAVTGQMLVYGIQTPFTIQLTPHEISLLKDYAYVSTNGTTITLDYHNGEMASLSDVSQVGNTLNNLGGFLNGVLDNKFDLGIGLPSGNVNLSIIQANFKSSGVAMHYVAESDWEGWSTIIGVLNNATVRSFIIISRRRIIYSYTTNNGTSWTTQTLVTAT